MDNSKQEKLEKAKNELRKLTFAPKPLNVCSHLLENIDSVEQVHYIATELIEYSYYLVLCCEKCAVKYHIPYPGVYINDVKGEELNETLVIVNASDEEKHPYHSLLKNQKGFYISVEAFEKIFTLVGHDEIINSRFKLPWGIEVIGTHKLCDQKKS